MLGEQLVNIQARTTGLPQSEESYQKGFFIVRVIFMATLLVVATVVPIGFALLVLADRKSPNILVGIMVILASATTISSIINFQKIVLLLRQYSENSSGVAPATIEDDVRYELGIELLSFGLTFVPIAHIFFCTQTIAKAIGILETTKAKQNIRKLASNIAGYAILVYMANSTFTSIAMIILVDKWL